VEGEAELRRADLAADPLDQFRGWFAEAAAALEVPEAMVLATAGADAAPSARMVLLKAVDERGLVFYSHYTSRKGRELEENPQAALLFHWSPLGRQVRVEGRVERVSAEESDAYFATRPRDAQVGAHASRQSEPLASREELDERLVAAAADLIGGPVSRPATWGGFLLVPQVWEFWQHRASRLHDRFRYEPDPTGGWRIERLFPYGRTRCSPNTGAGSTNHSGSEASAQASTASPSHDHTGRIGANPARMAVSMGSRASSHVRSAISYSTSPVRLQPPSVIVASTAAPFGMLAARSISPGASTGRISPAFSAHVRAKSRTTSSSAIASTAPYLRIAAPRETACRRGGRASPGAGRCR
jgi:pyridoxamine 5'-phosphate oxidase